MFKEQDVIIGCQNGDRASMEVLYNHYVRRMKAWVYRYARTTSDIDDILQEGFVKIFRNIHTFKNIGSFEGWLKRIMINSAINFYRKNINFYKEVNWEHVNETDVEATEIADNLCVEEIQELINKMPEGYKFVFNMYAIEGFSHKEIAEMLSIQEATSHSQYSRSKKYLINLIKERDKTEYEN